MHLGTHCNSFPPHAISPRVEQDWQTWSAHTRGALRGPELWLTQQGLCSLPVHGFSPVSSSMAKVNYLGLEQLWLRLAAEIGSLFLTVNLFDIAAEHYPGMENRLTLSSGLPRVCYIH